MDNELTTIRKNLRLITMYAGLMTVLFTVMAFSGFTQSTQKQNFEEITAKRILIVDSNGKARVLLAADYKKDNSV